MSESGKVGAYIEVAGTGRSTPEMYLFYLWQSAKQPGVDTEHNWLVGQLRNATDESGINLCLRQLNLKNENGWSDLEFLMVLDSKGTDAFRAQP